MCKITTEKIIFVLKFNQMLAAECKKGWIPCNMKQFSTTDLMILCMMLIA